MSKTRGRKGKRSKSATQGKAAAPEPAKAAKAIAPAPTSPERYGAAHAAASRLGGKKRQAAARAQRAAGNDDGPFRRDHIPTFAEFEQVDRAERQSRRRGRDDGLLW